MSTGRHRLHIAYYDGGYGPTLRIEAKTRFLVDRFAKTLALLAKGQLRRVELADPAYARTTDVGSVELLLTDGREPIGLFRLDGPQDSPRFRWSDTCDGWQSCLELIEPFLQSFEPGHAYLTSETAADVLVEFTYGESP